jgi:hypothetical protein
MSNGFESTRKTGFELVVSLALWRFAVITITHGLDAWRSVSR